MGVDNETVIVSEVENGYVVEGVFTFDRVIDGIENLNIPIVVRANESQIETAANCKMEAIFEGEIFTEFVPVKGDETCIRLPKELKIVWLQPVGKKNAVKNNKPDSRNVRIRYTQKSFGGYFYYYPNVSQVEGILAKERNWNCVLIFTRKIGVPGFQENRDCERIGKYLVVYLKDKELLILK